MNRQIFGTGPNGEEAHLYTLTNNRGVEVSITNYGGAVTSIKVPDRDGVFGDVVLGYDTNEEYMRNPRYLGALIGRHANRIAHGKFSFNGVAYQLAQNNGENHLHGGNKGFDKRFWEAAQNEAGLSLEYFSTDGEENYPGNLTVNVDYSLNEENELRIEYRATSDKDTIVNLTNHSYFNLACGGDILGHQLTLNADAFTPVSKDLIPTGEIRPVSNTPMDFRESRTIGSRIHDEYEQLAFTGGYDHNFLLRDWNGSLRRVAQLRDPASGRVLEVHTTEPGVQFYSGNFFDGSFGGKGGVVYEKYAGLCLETQHFPDSPNHPNFPTTVLRAGEQYRQTTIYKFTTG
ncbi:MAG TPA: aldose epimerase family protein [Pyrinomonadaceae bacterium]|nr:aldose epimerase family protein [Pyrinomonadaceae bacterium]